MNQMIAVTSMRIGEYEVSVPHGLSELLDSAGAWSLKPRQTTIIGYHREVVKKDGKLMTVLTRKAR